MYEEIKVYSTFILSCVFYCLHLIFLFIENRINFAQEPCMSTKTWNYTISKLTICEFRPNLLDSSRLALQYSGVNPG